PLPVTLLAQAAGLACRANPAAGDSAPHSLSFLSLYLGVSGPGQCLGGPVGNERTVAFGFAYECGRCAGFARRRFIAGRVSVRRKVRAAWSGRSGLRSKNYWL